MLTLSLSKKSRAKTIGQLSGKVSPKGTGLQTTWMDSKKSFYMFSTPNLLDNLQELIKNNESSQAETEENCTTDGCN